LVVPARKTLELDYAGAVLLMTGVTALLMWSSQVRSAPWSSLPQTLTLVAGFVLLAAFAVQEHRAAEPILPPRLYANRVILFTNLIGFLVATVNFAGLVLLPVFFQIVMNMGAAESGLMVIPMLFGIPIASFTSGQIMGRTGRYKGIIPSALALVTIAFGLFSTMTVETPLTAILGYIGLLGLGLGACFPVLMISTQNAAGAGDVGTATSSITFSRSLGASFGTALFWAVVLAPLSAASVSRAQAFFQFGRAGLARLAAPDQTALLSSLAQGFHDVFVIGAGVALATFTLSLFLHEEPLKTSPVTRTA
jgi:uncharacterized membrane protein SirB2